MLGYQSSVSPARYGAGVPLVGRCLEVPPSPSGSGSGTRMNEVPDREGWGSPIQGSGAIRHAFEHPEFGVGEAGGPAAPIPFTISGSPLGHLSELRLHTLGAIGSEFGHVCGGQEPLAHGVAVPTLGASATVSLARVARYVPHLDGEQSGRRQLTVAP